MREEHPIQLAVRHSITSMSFRSLLALQGLLFALTDLSIAAAGAYICSFRMLHAKPNIITFTCDKV
jgi:hypothetical protein